jgi:magnesium transporter
VTAILLDREGSEQHRIDRPTLEGRISAKEPFWLDLESPDEEEFQLLRDVFRFHPLAIEDAQTFHQRPKIDDYGDYFLIVVYGAAPPPDKDRLVELHCFYSEHYLVTVRREHAPGCNELRERYTRHPAPLERPLVVFYRLLDALSDSFYPALEDYDERIETVQEATFRNPSDEQLQGIVAMRRQLNRLRRVVGPQRDLVAQLFGGNSPLPASDVEAERYFRDVYDHLIHVTDLIDGYRDLLSGAMDVYLSAVSNRLNLVMERLTIISTIALPLIVITGFFGQNFRWLVTHINSLAAFLGFAIAVPIVAAFLLLVYLRRHRLL